MFQLYILFDPVIPLINLFLKEMIKNVLKDLCMRIFTLENNEHLEKSEKTNTSDIGL